MKHWFSEAPKETVEQRMVVTRDDLMALRPHVNLDFCCFDLETSNLRADFSITLTACIKPFAREPIVFRADNYSTWTADRENDSGIITDVATELARHAIIITHYGTGFDIPFLRAKLVKHKLAPLPPMFAVDTYSIAKANFAVSSRRLANLGTFFDLGEKSGVEGEKWMKAAYSGDRQAMDEIVAHNVQDVILLERLACLTFPYIKSIRRL